MKLRLQKFEGSKKKPLDYRLMEDQGSGGFPRVHFYAYSVNDHFVLMRNTIEYVGLVGKKEEPPIAVKHDLEEARSELEKRAKEEGERLAKREGLEFKNEIAST